jgi:hypothetical protein
MHAADQLRNDQEMVMWSVMLIVERTEMCLDNQGGHFENAHCT